MPTKLNKAGNQQNYVPAGNGDASGEYGDNADGSNVHFKSFAKPKDEKPEGKVVENKPKEKKVDTETDNVVVEQKGDKPMDVKPKKTFEDLSNSITQSLGGKLTPNGKKLVKNIEESNADPRFVSIMANLYETGNYQIKLGKNNSAYFNPYMGISLGAESLDGTYLYGKGSAFFHESGHALDYAFPKTEEERNQSSSLWDREKTWSMDYKSKKHGMTLQESVDDELKKYEGAGQQEKITTELKGMMKEIDPEYKTLVEQYDKAKQEFQEKSALREKIHVDRDEYVKTQLSKSKFPSNEVMHQKVEDGEITWDEYHDAQYKKYQKEQQLEKDYDLKHPEHANLEQEIHDAYDNYVSLSKDKSAKEFQTLGDISDMIQASAGYQICGGHNGAYFIGRDGKSNQATECFAEITQARAVNKNSLSILKKYIPRTLEIYEEIIGEIENGR